MASIADLRPMTLAEMRADFRRYRAGVPALPVAGCVAYATAAVLSLLVPTRWDNTVLLACFWSIMPLAVLIGLFAGGAPAGDPRNDLFRLSVLMRWMVLTTWAVHVPVWVYAPTLFPLTVGIVFGLHWVVFGWMIDRPLGLQHLALRTASVVVAWLAVPANRMGAVSLAVALTYGFSVWQLSRVDGVERAAADGFGDERG